MKIHNFKETKTCPKDLVGLRLQRKDSHSKRSLGKNWLQQGVSKNLNSPNSIMYDQFIYTDKLTKNKIRMKDAKNSYQDGRHVRNTCTLQFNNLSLNHQKKKRKSRVSRHQSNFKLQKQLTDLNECFLMLKSTEMFKLNSLRQKIFGSVDRAVKNSNTNLDQSNQKKTLLQGDNILDMQAKKNKIRQILQDTVKEANMKQFRQYCANDNHKLNHKILSMNRHIPKSFNKSNIQKIISRLQSRQKVDESCYRLLKKSYQDIQFPGQQKLKTQLIEYMRKQIKQNGQYLVVPEKKKLLFQRLYNNICTKTGTEQNAGKKAILQKNSDFAQNNTHDQSEFPSFVDIYIQSDKTINTKNEDSVRENEKQFSFDKDTLKKNDTFFTKNDKNIKQSDIIEKRHKSALKKVKFGQKSQNYFKERHKKENTCINLFSYNDQIDKQNVEHNKTTKLSPFLKDFVFSPSEKSHQIRTIKNSFQRNIKLSTKNYNMRQQRFMFLVQNGVLFDVQKQILMNEDYLFMKDKKQNNLLHICTKNHYTDMFNFITQRYRKSCNKKQPSWQDNILRTKLTEKNKNNKNVFDVAKLYQAKEILQILRKLKVQYDIREFIQ